MPERAEVACVASEINDKLSGTILQKVIIYPRAKEKRLNELVIGSILLGVISYGKKIIFNFQLPDGTITKMVSSLGMVGRWDWNTNINHIHCVFTFNKGNEMIEATYSDYRYFGSNIYCPTPNCFNEILSKLGPDIMSNDFTLQAFQQIAKKSPRAKIVSWLSNQAKMAGIGNYLRTEILYEARLHPNRLVKSLTYEEITILHQSIIKIIDIAKKHVGLTISTYTTPSGQRGSYPTKIYQQKTDPRGDNVNKIKVNGQTVFFVEGYQN